MSTEATNALETAAAAGPAAPPETGAPPTDATAAPADETKQQADERRFTQSELDALLQKRLAKQERKHLQELREIANRQQPAPREQAPQDDRPKRERYASDEEWVEAVTDWKTEQKLQARDRQTAQEREAQVLRSTASKTEKIYDAAAKLPGFDRETFDELPLTRVIAEAVIDSDVAPALMAYMASNPDDVERIAQLSPARQAAEIGRLEARISAARVEKKPPEPLRTVNASGTVSLSKLSEARNQEEFEKIRRRQIAARR